MRQVLVTVLLPCLALLFAQAAYAQCPAVGYSSNCGVVITITDAGGSVTATGIGPYDDIEDALVGVVNKSSTPITSIGLNGAGIFNFDYDGIDTYGIAGNSDDSTGYGGPNAYFTAISADLASGTVNFITPIAPNGGIAYFSLEGAPTSTCNSILNNSVPKPPGGGTAIMTTFAPQGYTLAQAAQLCGFDDWDFQQTITKLPKPSPFCAKGNSLCNPGTLIGHLFTLSAPVAFNDPITPHGYAYQDPSVCADRDKSTGQCLLYYQSDDPNPLPLYFNPALPASNMWSLQYDFGKRTASSLFWYDSPADPCLPGAASSPCYGGFAPFGSKIAFTTHLVGIKGTYPNITIVDTGIGFDWTSSFNGLSSGSIAVTGTPFPVVPGSGTGEVTVTGYNGIATLTSAGTAVTSINGHPTGSQGQMNLPSLPSTPGQASTPCNGTYGGTFTGNVFVGAGSTCSFQNARITGNILVVGGQLSLQGDDISGIVAIENSGSFSQIGNTSIGGNLVIENTSQTGASSQICNATVYGNLVAIANSANLQIGNSQAGCAGNVVAGLLDVLNNVGTVSVDGNSVTQNIAVIGNGGATDISSNNLLGALVCINNKVLTGSNNATKSKQGQCSTF